MKCPNCEKEMAELESPGVQLAPVNEEGKDYPVKVVANIIKLYGCTDCNIKAVKTSPLEYYPTTKCCDNCRKDENCNCVGECTCVENCNCSEDCSCENGQNKHI